MAFNIVIGIVALFFIFNTARLSKQIGEFAIDEFMAGLGLVTILVVIKLISEGRLNI